MEWWLGHAGRVAAPAPLFFAWQPACSCGMLDCAVPGHIHGDMVGDRVCMKKKIMMIIISSLKIIMIFIMIMAMAMAMIITKIKMKRTRKKEKEKNNGHKE